MGSINDVIDAFRKAPTNVERGTMFEKLMVRYFELDPTLAQQYDAVWRWIDWPDRKGKPDTGIDLVARDRDTGEYTAIQCKFYEPDPHAGQGRHRLVLHRLGQEAVHQPGDHLHHRQVGQERRGRARRTSRSRCSAIGLADIAESPIDWDIAWPQGDADDRPARQPSENSPARTSGRRSTRCSPGSPSATTAAS